MKSYGNEQSVRVGAHAFGCDGVRARDVPRMRDQKINPNTAIVVDVLSSPDVELGPGSTD